MKRDKIIKLASSVFVFLVGVVLIYYVYEKASVEEVPNKDILIEKDTLFLCPGDEYVDGKIVKVTATEGKKESEVCDGEFVGKYVCENTYCGEPAYGQLGSYYINYQEGIALIRDINYDENSFDNGLNMNEPSLSFLYNFKDKRKISEEYDFYTTLLEKNNKSYFLTITNSNLSGIIDNQGKIIAPSIYKQIGITPFEEGIDGQMDNIIVAIRNDKFGFLNIETGQEITNFDFDKFGFITVDEPNNYDPGEISRHDTTIINKDLKEVYVEEDNQGMIINIETGKVIKELGRTYVSGFPITDDLILVEEENNVVDIIDYNLTSVLDSKLEFEGYITYGINENKLNLWETTEKMSKIKHIFDIETRKIIK